MKTNKCTCVEFTIVKAVIALMCIATTNAFAQSSECGDVLKDGTKAVQLFHENNEYRRLLETKLVSMTFQQAKTDTSITGNIPIGDVVLGAGFTEKSFDDYQSYLQKNSSLFIESSHSVDILLSTGDSEILAAWSGCMQNRSGLALRFKESHARSAVLVIQWFAAAGVPQVKIAQDYKLPSGVSVTSGKDFLDGKLPIIAGTNHEVKFELLNPETTLALTLNAITENTPRGADSAFLPSRMKWFRDTRPYQFNVSGGICSTAPTIYLDAPHHSGTVLPTVTYCSSLKDGWRFSKRLGDFSVTSGVSPSYIPGVQIAHAPSWWTGEDQFNVSLGCSSSTNADIQCSATTRLTEERQVWMPSSD
ncbi:hypothetical protein J2W17_003194 [Pseudomonas lini]|uniref:hypothetical protein n=1 Tax=Pseudomonas lini TaxID=163011 RepID=UPI002783462A|nr:hypothetical protein [Pseudomonas lini]MDQ0124246.1 hypothetical protein [Pseudomonas lini]